MEKQVECTWQRELLVLRPVACGHIIGEAGPSAGPTPGKI